MDPCCPWVLPSVGQGTDPRVRACEWAHSLAPVHLLHASAKSAFPRAPHLSTTPAFTSAFLSACILFFYPFHWQTPTHPSRPRPN